MRTRAGAGSRGSGRRVRLLSAVALAVAALYAAPAHAARVPAGFYGTTWDGLITQAPRSQQVAQWNAMASAGVKSVRATFNWASAQPQPSGPIDFSATDEIVAYAAQHRIDLLPIVLYTPSWAAKFPGLAGSPPAGTAAYVAYLQALVARYGPRGSFWSQHPGLPRRPVREWQIWNEPDLLGYWNERNFAHGYGRLLRASYQALKRADSHCRVVMAGLVNFPWIDLRALFTKGHVRGYFDVLAIHMYTGHPAGLITIMQRFERVMRQNRAAGMPVWVTEFGWAASKGRTYDPQLRSIATTDRAMPGLLTRAYQLLAAHSRAWNLQRAYWYTWSSSYARNTSVFQFAGLVRYDGVRAVAMPALSAYRAAARGARG